MRCLTFFLLGLSCSASACFSSGYVPRSLHHDAELDARAVRSLGCLDVGLSVRGPADAPILRTKLGNGCLEPALFDVTRFVIRGIEEDGADRSLAIDDPRQELVALHVDGRRRAVEAFRLLGARKPMTKLCIDVRGVAWSETVPPPICFAPGGAVNWQVVS